MIDDEDAELRWIKEQVIASTRIVDATAAMCDGIVGSAESLIKEALDRAVTIGSYTSRNAEDVKDLFRGRAASLRSALSSKVRTQAFFAAQAALDMTGIALAIGEGLPSDEVIKLAKAGFAETVRNKQRASKSAKERNTDDTWKPHALELAKQIQSESDFTQQEIADRIEAGWRLLGVSCPSSMLVRQIRQWMTQGELRKSSRMRRPAQ